MKYLLNYYSGEYFFINKGDSGYWYICDLSGFLHRIEIVEIIKRYEQDFNLNYDGRFKTQEDAELFITNYIEPYLIMKKLSGKS